MQASLSGSLACAPAGGQTRLDLDPNGSASVILKEVRDGASDTFACAFVDHNDALIAARWKPGSSVSGSISVDNSADARNAKVVYKPNGDPQQVLLTVAAGGSASVSFAFASQGDALFVERA